MSTPAKPEPTSIMTHMVYIELSIALKALSDAVSARADTECPFYLTSPVGQAIRALETLLGELNPTPEMTRAEASFYHACHVWMRKGMDGPLSSLLWRAVHDSTGSGVFVAFCKGAVASLEKPKRCYDTAQHTMKRYYQDHDDLPANTTMACLLELWPKDEFDTMIEAFKGPDGWLEDEDETEEEIKA